MKVVKFEKILNLKDVEELNKSLPDVIELKSLKGQKSGVLSKIDSKIKIRILDEEIEKEEKEISGNKIVSYAIKKDFSPEEISEILKTYETIEEDISVNYNDLESALHTYLEFIKIVEPLDLEKTLDKIDVENSETLSALINKKALSKGYATIYKQAMERLGIPCKIIESPDGYAWNEIMIDGEYYPLDLAFDAEFYRSKEAEGKIGFCKFLTDKEFYKDQRHYNPDIIAKEKFRALDESETLKAYEKIQAYSMSKNKTPRPSINIKSKELDGIFKGNVISNETIVEVENLKISLQSNNVEQLKEDIAEIGKYYPEVLNNIELENATDSSINMQELVDGIYASREEAKKLGQDLSPIEFTISSKNAEDFDLDFSNAPEELLENNTPIDSNIESKIKLKNLSNASIQIPSLKNKISKNIKALDLTGFDLQGLDLTDTNIETIALHSNLTKNIDQIIGIKQISNIELKSIDPIQFNNIYSQIIDPLSNVHSIRVENINLRDRRILEELSTNTKLARIWFQNCNLNNIDGLENFDKRIAFLFLANNELDINHLERLNKFYKNNPYLELYANNNMGINNAILSSPEISDESFNYIKNWFENSQNVNISNKNSAVDRLTWGHPDVPYYIKDAKIIRDNINITLNPVMLENDNELDTVNFNETYLKDATLLLTIPQIERLLALGKTIPQNIRINIHDVTELSSQKARQLETKMISQGMKLEGVQIFDKQGANAFNNIAPYTMSQYIYIRETLDKVVGGIDLSEPDIDKFAVIYDRLASKIVYDTPATKDDNFNEAMYYAEKRNTSRNLLEGLEEEKCVCAGYADILRNALLLVGIDARYNSGLCDKNDLKTGHAWNQVRLDDGTGTKKWYYTDLTWDAGKNNYNWTLLGNDNFKSHTYMNSVGASYSHDLTNTKNIETCTNEDFDRIMLREALQRAKVRNNGYDYMNTVEIDIPEDPKVQIEVLDSQRIADEFRRRKNDMYAKFYGNKEYEEEYEIRNKRFRQHEIEVTNYGITYRTVEDYPERQQDEEFLLLDKYKECLERMTRYQAGDTSVYIGTDSQIKLQLEKDREYVETRNHTFDQNKSTQKDLATLGKYGEKMPYIPKKPGAINNVLRVVGNVGIFTRNLVSPVYRAVGKYVAQPLHRLRTGQKDASPYKNNFYHRMVARREYFDEINRAQNPRNFIGNFVKSRAQAIFRAEEGNEAILRAGAADIRENIVSQERQKVLIQNLENTVSKFNLQIQDLQQQIIDNPKASNISAVRAAIQNKILERDRLKNTIDGQKNNVEGTLQTDAISDKQHAVASKEVNTFKVTVIKGVAKGITAKYVGPKIHDWLLERGKVVKPIEIVTEVPETKQRWIETTYKEELVPIYEDVVDKARNIKDIISGNKGKNVTGFYSVYGGEKGAATYELLGNEKITAIFQAKGNGGTGLSDLVGLKAPTLTNNTFSSELLDSTGLLNQNITIDEMLNAINVGKLDPDVLNELYVSVGDKYWTKLSDLVGDMTAQVKVGEEIQKVVDVAGHYETYTEMVEKVIKTTEVVTNPAVQKAVDIGGKMGAGLIIGDSILDAAENLRKTETNVKDNKKKPRKYTFDEDVDDIPKSKRDYDRDSR